MRLWSLHPQYLDGKGLVALWREALLAQKVLAGKTRGYVHHPQLERFKQTSNPVATISTYLNAIADEAVVRGYSFDRGKIGREGVSGTIEVSVGQLIYERKHLLNKLEKRDQDCFFRLQGEVDIIPHPLFISVPGDIENWELVAK